jgi:zinc protease
MGYPADVSIKSKDFCASQLANAALGHDTISSRLAELRNKHGLTYGINSMFSENARPMAPWLIEFSVAPENASQAMKLVKGIVNKYVSSGMTPEELKVEKQRIAGEYVVNRLRTAKNIADALTKYGALDMGPDFIDKYPSMLNQVTLKEANSVISRFMNWQNLTTSMAGTMPSNMKESKP